jgi:sugar lactone lactonase YvrE
MSAQEKKRFESAPRNQWSRWVAVLSLIVVLIAAPAAFGKDKKKKTVNPATQPATPQEKFARLFQNLDKSKIVWPSPPAIARIKYLDYWSGEKYVPAVNKKKSSWMQRVAGVTTGETPSSHPRWQLVIPNGVAVDSKGLVYIADSKVRAIFLLNAETGEYQMIKNGSEARFQWLTGLAIDDADRLFAADSGMRRVLIFGSNHKPEGSISEGLVDPGGIAIDNENRFLYVADAEQDQVLVYDADPPYKLLRRIGTPGKNHTLATPGDFSKPTYLAVDGDGNLFVSDTWNNRIQVFDADGNFIRTFGKAGDGPGYFARPKGIAIDCDGHVWVADGVQDRLQVFTPDGHLLAYLGGHGLLPGQFESLINVAIDKNNRVITTEQLAPRAQLFRYVTEAEAKGEREKHDSEAAQRPKEKSEAPAPVAPGQVEKH